MDETQTQAPAQPGLAAPQVVDTPAMQSVPPTLIQYAFAFGPSPDLMDEPAGAPNAGYVIRWIVGDVEQKPLFLAHDPAKAEYTFRLTMPMGHKAMVGMFARNTKGEHSMMMPFEWYSDGLRVLRNPGSPEGMLHMVSARVVEPPVGLTVESQQIQGQVPADQPDQPGPTPISPIPESANAA